MFIWKWRPTALWDPRPWQVPSSGSCPLKKVNRYKWSAISFTKHITFNRLLISQEQGSSENDARSNVYDHSECKVFLTAVIPTAVTPTAVILLEFTWIYLYLPTFYLKLPEFTEFTQTCLSWNELTWSYMNFPKFSQIYLKIHKVT